MSSALEIASVLREGDIKALCVEFNIPKGMSWRVPDPEDRAPTPPEGHITIYEAHLRSGVRLPLPSELESILRALRIPLAQLHANAVRYICSLCIFARKLNQKFRMSGLRVVFKLNKGPEWTSLTPRPGFKISTAIYDSLKNWKSRFFFVKVGEAWPLAKAWGEVPAAYFGTPSPAERSAYGWLLRAIESNPNEFKRDFLVSREETRKADWGPPSPTQKSGPPARMLSPEESKKLLIRERPEEEFEGAMETPSSSSSHFDYVAAGVCCGAGSTSNPGDAEGIPVDAGVILAQPAARVTPGAAWLESAEEPALDVPEGSRAYIVGQSGAGPRARRAPRGKRPAAEIAPEAAGEESAGGVLAELRAYVKGPAWKAALAAVAPKTAKRKKLAAAVTPEAARVEPTAAATPEAAREEPAAAAVDDDEFLDTLFAEVDADRERMGAPASTSLIPPAAGPDLEPKPERLPLKIHEV